MYAWTGKILRLNMTAKTATIEDNKYCKDYLGGQGLANRIIYLSLIHISEPTRP